MNRFPYVCSPTLRGRVLSFLLAAIAAGVVTPLAGWAAWEGEEAAISSQLQAMSMGTYSEREWSEMVARIDGVIGQARQASDLNRVVDFTVIKSRALTVRGQSGEALHLLLGTINEFDNRDVPSIRKAYVEAAEIYARQGKENAVVDIMNRFRKSPNFDAEEYRYEGGSSPSDFILIQRPNAPSGDSISLTALEVARTKARHGEGQPFPLFRADGWEGASYSLDSFRGQVVLIDFWAQGWHVWKRDLAYLQSIYSRQHPQGFQILGLSIDPDPNRARAFAQSQRLAWPLATAPRDLLRTLGIFGEAANFLVNQDGIIIGRDLHGADLDTAVRQALKR